MAKRSDKNAVNEWPVITENHWYALAIVSAILTIIAICSAFGWIFLDGFDPELDLKIAQTLAPFGVALFALVTFCTVAWRGSVSVRQANQAESEGRAKLLQEGAKLLGETANHSHVSAGIATLEILVSGPDERLAVQAMNLIADLIQREMAELPSHPLQEEAFAALSSGADLAREANRNIKFKEGRVASGHEWKTITGVKGASFTGGAISDGVFGDFTDSQKFTYNKVKIWLSDPIDVAFRFNECEFNYCRINSVDERYSPRGSKNKFVQCDFSGCHFRVDDDYDLSIIKEGQNYFRRGSPPTLNNESPIDWTQYLEERD